MLLTLAAGGTVRVSTVTTAAVEIEGSRTQLDLRSKASRLLVENAALTAAAEAGLRIENL